MKSKTTVFLLEDDRDIRDVVEEILRLRGVEVVSAHDGLDALSRLREGLRPGLILLDYMMPKMDGLEFRKRQLEEFPETSKTPTILMSADRRVSSRLQEFSAHSFLAKPMNLDTLLRIVDEHLVAD